MFTSERMRKSLRSAMLVLCSLLLAVGTISAQNITVKGTVIDGAGEPVVGAYVLVEGTQVGTMADENGSYSISAPANGRLVFSFMGYRDQIVAINGRAVVDVILVEDATMLADAVVVGFGTQKKENLTGAVTSVNVEEALVARPIADVGRGLQGTAPGLSVVVPSGEVGSDPVMRIRGTIGSIEGSSSPLILLDNVEIPSINLVNPNDIESVTVLKDAASASIYGAKAAFGVILLTSKKGANVDRVDVQYSGNVAFQNIAKDYEMGDVDALRYTVEAAERVGTTTPVGAFWLIDRDGYNAAVAWKEKYGNSLDPYAPMVYGRDWYAHPGNQNQKIGVRTYNPYDYVVREWAPTHNHNISVNGRSGNTTYNMSVGYLDQSGMMKTADHDDYRRWNASARINSKINQYLDLHAGLIYSRSQKRYAYATNSTSADIWYYLYRWGPTFPLTTADENGNPLRNFTCESAAANTATRTTNYTSANAGLTITPLKDWTIDLDYTFSNNEFVYFAPGTRFTGGDTWGAPLPRYNADGSRAQATNEWSQFNGMPATVDAYMLNCYQYTSNGSNPDHVRREASDGARSTLNLTTNYDLNINDTHHFHFLAGMNAVKYDYAYNWSQITTLIDINNPQFTLSNGTQTSGGSESWESQLGFFGRVNYALKDRYLLEANIRYDGSSKFPTDLQWRWYPSFSAAWRVMEEPWMEFAKQAVSALKLRASWGSIGDQTVPSNLYVPTMSRSELAWVMSGAKLVYYGTPAAVSDAITWQDIVTLDFGVDASFFADGALSFTFDWFQRDTDNMLVPMEGVSYTFGTTAPKGNFGSFRTRGWELAVNYGHQFSNGLTLTVDATLADALTKVTAYGSTNLIDEYYVGKTIGEIWGYETDRLYTKDDFVLNENGDYNMIKTEEGYDVYETKDGVTQGYLQNSSSFKFGAGDVKFKDLNGDGKIDAGKRTLKEHGDLKVIGNTTPRYEYSLRLALAWKGFDFSVFFQGVGKREMWANSPLSQAGWNSSDGAMPQAMAGDFWIEGVNEDAFWPRAFNNGASASINNMQVQSRYLLDMSYLRLKNLTFGYTLPEKLTKKALLNKVRVYVALENFLTFDNLNGLPIDPEAIAGYSMLNTSNYNSGRVGVGTPAFKTASFGLQINF